MSAQIKEALAAWEAARSFLELQEEDEGCGTDEDEDNEEAAERANQRKAITVALEAAQQEAEAWEAIDAWITKRKNEADVPRYEECPVFFFDGEFNIGFAPHGELSAEHTAKTLSELAAWCRAELAK